MPEIPLACRMDALDAAGRARHGTLVAELKSNVQALEELPEGYAIRFPARPYLFLRVAEWIELERACCPFLTIRLELEHANHSMRVSLTGPAGTKDFLRAELNLAAIEISG